MKHFAGTSDFIAQVPHLLRLTLFRPEVSEEVFAGLGASSGSLASVSHPLYRIWRDARVASRMQHLSLDRLRALRPHDMQSRCLELSLKYGSARQKCLGKQIEKRKT